MLLGTCAVQEGTVFAQSNISYRAFHQHPQPVGSKTVLWYLSPGTASYQCLFLLKNKQKNRRFGFKRDEWRWENKYRGEGLTVSLWQVLPGILSARPQPWTLHPAHWFHPHPLKPQGPIHRHPSGQALKQLSYIKEMRLENRNRAVFLPQPMRSPQGPAEKSLNPGSLIALRKHGEPESPWAAFGRTRQTDLDSHPVIH